MIQTTDMTNGELTSLKIAHGQWRRTVQLALQTPRYIRYSNDDDPATILCICSCVCLVCAQCTLGVANHTCDAVIANSSTIVRTPLYSSVFPLFFCIEGTTCKGQDLYVHQDACHPGVLKVYYHPHTTCASAWLQHLLDGDFPFMDYPLKLLAKKEGYPTTC